MTDFLNRALRLEEIAETAGVSNEMTSGEHAHLMAQLAIASALISLAQTMGKIELLLRQRMKK